MESSESGTFLLKVDEVSTAISKSFKFPAFERISKVLSMVLEKFQPDKLDKQSEYLLLYMGVPLDENRTLISYDLKNKDKLVLAKKNEDVAAMQPGTEDSDSIRLQIKHHEERKEEFLGTIKKTSKIAKEYETQYADVEQQLHLFCECMRQFETPYDIEKRKRMEKARSEYDTAMSKHRQLCKKKGAEPDLLMAMEEAVTTLKTQLDYRTDEYVQAFQTIESKKESRVLATLLDYFNLQKAYLERGMKIMNAAEPLLSSLQTMVDTKFTTKKTEFEGFLFKKSKNGLVWHRCWVTLKDGYLSWQKHGKDADKTMINIMLCSVKQATNIDRQFAFELITLNRRLLFQAESNDDMTSWISSIESSISCQLNSQTSAKKKSENPEAASEYNLQMLCKEELGNNVCADCGADMPEWLSLNLGIMICLECSGCHRSLGTHLSKVRSATLDTLDDITLRMMRRLGNAGVNGIFEHSRNFQKPKPDSERSFRSMYIKTKYEAKSFIKPLASNADQCTELYSAINRDDLQTILWLVSVGVDPSLPNPRQLHVTPLHYAVRHNHPLVASFLAVQNGVDVNALDDNGDTPLHIAADKNLTNKAGQTPLSLVGNASEDDEDEDVCSRIMKGEKARFSILENKNGSLVFAIDRVGDDEPRSAKTTIDSDDRPTSRPLPSRQTPSSPASNAPEHPPPRLALSDNKVLPPIPPRKHPTIVRTNPPENSQSAGTSGVSSPMPSTTDSNHPDSARPIPPKKPLPTPVPRKPS